MTRILVTGSRSWRDQWAIHTALSGYLRTVGQWDDDAGMATGDVTVVHGACRTGADHYADEWALSQCLAPERHPAQWGRLGKAAGHARNAAMVKLGADCCLAFILPCRNDTPECAARGPHGSHGATGCADMAEAAGIPTTRIEAAT